MRPKLLLITLAAVACRPGAAARPERRDSLTASRALEEAPVIREPTVVAFWLPASDTLKQGEGADLLDDFRAYTGAVSPLLDQQGIKLETTTADSVVVELENGPRRVIRLSGLDYPFGYVLVEPGYPETILTGVSTDDELLEQVSWYFGLDEPDSSDAPGIRRTAGSAMSSRGSHRPSTSRTRSASDPGENGLCRNEVFGSRLPCWRMASSVYPET